jgi:alpha-amylase/alpha-mannosidase (GH57 family)
MKNIRQFILVIMSVVVLLSACGAPTAAPTSVETTPTLSAQAPTVAPASEVEPIYLAIIWHQHQPVYFKDPDTGIYVRPWVRVHASKDYVDMAAILKQYPKIHATFNLTPSLIRQLDDLAGGAKDLYWVYTEIPASELSIEQKQFILERFFDINRKIIDRFPRYKELLQKRASADEPISEFSDQDFLDLQVLFNLAWTDPDWLEQEPLASLMAKGKDFCEEDKAILFTEHLKLIQEVIPIHRELQDAGQIEVTMTPFAHPILPLLVTTDLAREALPDLELPDTKFVYGQDAVAQVALGVQLYEEHFGCPPRGMWPAEGSVAQEIVSMVAQNDLQWMASDEGVLANSLGFTSFIRNANETVIDADMLYRPYYVEGKRGGPVATVFRHSQRVPGYCTGPAQTRSSMGRFLDKP